MYYDIRYIIYGGLYPPPPIPIGLHCTPLDSTGLHWTPLDSTGLHWIPMESYGTFVSTDMSQHLKPYRTYFPQFLSKSSGLTMESTGNWHRNPMEFSGQILSYLIFVLTELKKPMLLMRIDEN